VRRALSDALAAQEFSLLPNRCIRSRPHRVPRFRDDSLSPQTLYEEDVMSRNYPARPQRRALVGALLAALAVVPPGALASSHREAPAITQTPKLDGTDLYAFRSYEPDARATSRSSRTTCRCRIRTAARTISRWTPTALSREAGQPASTRRQPQSNPDAKISSTMPRHWYGTLARIHAVSAELSPSVTT
jgi:hypothetical protein